MIDENNAVRHKDKEAHINILHFNTNGRIGTWAFYKYDDWVPMKRAEWYEDIPEQGVIGKGWDFDLNDFNICVCTKYNKNDKERYPFITNKNCYKNFKPLTKEEVMQYILPD